MGDREAAQSKFDFFDDSLTLIACVCVFVPSVSSFGREWGRVHIPANPSRRSHEECFEQNRLQSKELPPGPALAEKSL